MQRVFDDTWGRHAPDFAEGSASEAARETLARAILNIVARGERNAGIVKAYATGVLMLHRNF